MNFLAAICTQLIQWALQKVGALIAAAYAKFKRREQIEKEADASVKPLKDAKTKDEIDKATDSTLGGF